MKPLDVFISAKDKRAFTRRALAHYRKGKGEHIEGALVRRTIGQFHIEGLVPMKLEPLPEGADPNVWVSYNEEAYREQKLKARKLGLDLITIHSHPNCEGTPSLTDHVDSFLTDEVLMGILEMWFPDSGRAQTKLSFWVPQLPCAVKILPR